MAGRRVTPLVLHPGTLRKAAAVCRQLARRWGRETAARIEGKSNSDDWSDSSARAAAAAECAQAIEALLADARRKEVG